VHRTPTGATRRLGKYFPSATHRGVSSSGQGWSFSRGFAEASLARRQDPQGLCRYSSAQHISLVRLARRVSPEIREADSPQSEGSIPSSIRDRNVLTRLGIAVLLAGMLISPLVARSPYLQSKQSAPAAQSSPSPLTLDEVLRLIKQNKSDPKAVAPAISERGVNFELEEKTQKKLQKAGADDELLADIWKVTPSGKAHMQALLTSPSGLELRASAGEALALQDIQNERSPDQRLRMVEAFEKKFPESESPVRSMRPDARDVSVLFTVYDPSLAA